MTTPFNDCVAMWMENANRYRIPTKLEQIELGNIIRDWQDNNGNEKRGRRALEKLVRGNLGLIVKAWRRNFGFIRHNDRRLPDLLQEGALGLRHAAIKYDPARGYAFSTYAMNWLVKYMGDYLNMRDRSVRVSSTCAMVVMAAKKAQNEALVKLGRRLTIQELSSKLNKPEATIEFFLERHEQTEVASLNRRAADDDTSSEVGDLLASGPDYDLEQDARCERLLQMVELIFDAAQLDEKQRTVVTERHLYGEIPMSFDKLGEMIGRSGNHVPAVLDRIIRDCGRAAASQGLSLDEVLSAA